MYKVESKLNQVAITRTLVPEELMFSVSPDSGTEMSVTTTAAEREQAEMEPLEVSAAREAVATLRAVKQRLETQHHRVERMLGENRASMADIREVYGWNKLRLQYWSIYVRIAMFFGLGVAIRLMVHTQNHNRR